METTKNTWLEDSVHLLEELRTAGRSGDPEGAARAAHTLKSSSAHVGAKKLSQLAREVEACARRGSTRDVRLRLPLLESEYRKACRALQAHQAVEAI